MKIHSAITLSVLTGLFLFNTQAFAQDNQNNDTNNLVPANANNSAMPPSAEKDAMITQAIKNLIQQSNVLAKFNINVSTLNGVVTLIGTVDSNTQASLLVEKVQTVDGVTDINTAKLKVKGGQQPLTDTLTTAKIKGLLIREKLFGERDVAALNTKVETKDGVVYLSGEVDNQEQIDNAIAIIKKSVPEVKSVEYSVSKTNQN